VFLYRLRVLSALSPGEVKWHFVRTLTSTVTECKRLILSGEESFKPYNLYFGVAIFGIANTQMNG